MKTKWNKIPKAHREKLKSHTERKLRAIKPLGQKKRAWRTFSYFIRLRDCIATTGTTKRGICVTCGKDCKFTEANAGHAIQGRNNSILLDEELVNLQCYRCNVMMGGRYADYSLWFIKKYGVELWEEKLNQSKQVGVKIDWDAKTLEYKEKTRKLLLDYEKNYGDQGDT